jgi:hypothetical protein
MGEVQLKSTNTAWLLYTACYQSNTIGLAH